ncbi:DUF3987 domain-containing protein [Xanthobacter autotrophicus]|uniref:DUF3987 domain-containing protein n=1 Tax=Xanthobacter autotrophicus TaxID=280 RepID=UPI00372B8FA4
MREKEKGWPLPRPVHSKHKGPATVGNISNSTLAGNAKFSEIATEELAAALDYATKGWPVFPCDPATKAPLTDHGHRDATTIVPIIRAWWQRWPQAMVGLPTGTASGVWVLDLDVDPEKRLDGGAALDQLEATHGRLPNCPCAETPRCGTHLFFRFDPDRPVKNSVGKVAPGIDVRGDGGYVVLAPSVRSDGRSYQWLSVPFADTDFPDAPDWLYRLIERPKPEPASAPSPAIRLLPDTLDPRRLAYARSALDREAKAVASAAEGGRNHRLNVAAHNCATYAAAGFLDEGEAREALLAAALECGLSVPEARRTITSGMKAGLAKPASFPAAWADEEEEARRAVELNRDLASPDNGAPSEVGAAAVAAGATWAAPDMSMLGEHRRAPPAFDSDWFGPQLAAWVRATAKATCAPVDYVGTALLALAGGVIGNQRRALAGAKWNEPPILFSALVGFPSAGKSPALGAVMSLVSDEEARLDSVYREQMAEWETKKVAAEAVRAAYKSALREAMRGDPELTRAVPLSVPEGMDEPTKPFLGRVMVQDATIEKLAHIAQGNPKGFLSFHDELAGLFASFGRYSGSGGADRTFWLQAYNGRSHIVDRVKVDDPIRIPHLAIGIVGGIQPDRAAELITGTDDGLVSRFLWCWPDPVPGFTVARERVDDSVAQRVISRLARLGMDPQPAGRPDTPVLVPLEEAAIQRLEHIARDMKAREEGASRLMRGTLGKVRGNVVRLATILAYLWWAASSRDPFDEPTEIGEAAVATACEMMLSYFIPMAERVFGDAAVPAVESNAAALARYLQANSLKTFNASKLRYKIGGQLRQAAAMTAACEELEDLGYIKAAAVPGSRGKGRPAKDFMVCPPTAVPD